MKKGRSLRRGRELRGVMTPPEARLWLALQSRRLGGVRLRRQHPVGPWILDFYCAERKLAVEVDGWSHNMGDLGRDDRRDADLARRGVRVVRIAALEVKENLDGVLETITAELAGRLIPPG